MTGKENTGQPFILTITSGKGGVGKSMISVNIAEMLGKAGYRVALIDADIGFSNCATLMNESVTASIDQWVNGECVLEDLYHHCGFLTLVTVSHEPGKLQFQPDLLMDALDQVTRELLHLHDFLIIDTPAGSGEITLWALDQADLGVVLLVEEPTAISDVYRLCKYVYSVDPDYPFASIVNFAESEAAALSTSGRFNNILSYFLDKQTHYLGHVPYSEAVRSSVKNQQTLLHSQPENLLMNDFRFIYQNIIGHAKKRHQSQTSIIH